MCATRNPGRTLRDSQGARRDGRERRSRILKTLADRKDMTVVMAVPVPELVEPLAHRIAILAEGKIIAYDTPDGLRRLSGCDGPLQEVLETLIHPDVFEDLEQYLTGRQA